MRGPGRRAATNDDDDGDQQPVTTVLPSQWRAAQDTEGRTYYYHAETQRVGAMIHHRNTLG